MSDIYEQGPEKRRVNVEACFAKLQGAITNLDTKIDGEFKVVKVEQKAIRSHLQRLNTYNKHCEERRENQEKELSDLRDKCNNHLTIQSTKSEIKTKSKSFLLIIIGLVINFIALLFLAYRTFA